MSLQQSANNLPNNLNLTTASSGNVTFTATPSNVDNWADSSNYSSLSTSLSTISTNANSQTYLYYGNSSHFQYEDENEKIISLLLDYLKEDELSELLDNIIERSDLLNKDTEPIKSTIRRIVTHRHLSEEFILKYYEYLTKESILRLHTSDIASKQYANLALLLINDEEKN